ncbi:SDR family NAD(P)-dependent oxidoreductase [Novosphingobium sp. YJ-S2-02]|uniref:SDR family NAD(P)-dependent oxidoreductase n=1 Tax=Novosphingobium aureum TaxID=2792964 RepID=A0A931MMJ0_9SPHN|nr:SDR family NAD(P)-dependent oxidoreductase [Novosphingobium aureum]MBH0115192.1 SDR family NAD(P)-dependent oxidoreductase [Novosphingobium aureum]
MSTIALVTGASRGAGRGIACALGSHGATVYVTGRSETSQDHPLPGTIHETAQAVTEAGGKGIAVRCDHGDDRQVEALFQRIEAESGRLDICVNNAAAIYDELTTPGNFWEKPLKLADIIDVGIRSSYVASWHAARMMVPRGRGVIAFTSASGAAHYVYGPGYGTHKAGVDKMAFDMGVDLAGTGVIALSVWMGGLLTDRMKAMIAAESEKYGYLNDRLETPEFTGHVLWAIAQDPGNAKYLGHTIIGAEVAREYGILDAGGRQPPSYRESDNVWPLQQFERVIR